MIVEQLAVIFAALFAGAAVYVSFAEQPAHMTLDDRASLAQWRPAYKRGFLLQATLAILGFVFGLQAWRRIGDSRWLVGAAILIANWPYTLIGMLGINRQLMATNPAQAGSDSRTLPKRWGRLHVVRAALGWAALAIFFRAAIGT